MSNAVMPENTPGIAIGELRHKRQLAAHCLDRAAQRGGGHVCAVLYVGDLLMRDAQEFCHLDLRHLGRGVAPANSYPH
jgi:hypothetical protein